jgi:hypothetical protein
MANNHDQQPEAERSNELWMEYLTRRPDTQAFISWASTLSDRDKAILSERVAREGSKRDDKRFIESLKALRREQPWSVRQHESGTWTYSALNTKGLLTHGVGYSSREEALEVVAHKLSMTALAYQRLAEELREAAEKVVETAQVDPDNPARSTVFSEELTALKALLERGPHPDNG